MSSAFDNGIPNLQSSDATRNAARKTIFNNLRRETQDSVSNQARKYQPIRVCSTDGCVVSTPSYESKMDLNFGWLLCKTPWCSYNLTNPASRSASGKYLELSTGAVTQSVVDTDADPGLYSAIATLEPWNYRTAPNSSKIVMNLGGGTYYSIYKPTDLHVDPDGKLFSGQQMKTSSSTIQNIRYCKKNSSLWTNYIAPQSQYTQYTDANPYQIIAAQHTSRVPTNITYGTRYSILEANGSKNETSLVEPCPCSRFAIAIAYLTSHFAQYMPNYTLVVVGEPYKMDTDLATGSPDSITNGKAPYIHFTGNRSTPNQHGQVERPPPKHKARLEESNRDPIVRHHLGYVNSQLLDVKGIGHLDAGLKDLGLHTIGLVHNDALKILHESGYALSTHEHEKAGTTLTIHDHTRYSTAIAFLRAHLGDYLPNHDLAIVGEKDKMDVELADGSPSSLTDSGHAPYVYLTNDLFHHAPGTLTTAQTTQLSSSKDNVKVNAHVLYGNKHAEDITGTGDPAHPTVPSQDLGTHSLAAIHSEKQTILLADGYGATPHEVDGVILYVHDHT
jgi:hypothetical protein